MNILNKEELSEQTISNITSAIIEKAKEWQ